MKIAVAGTGYVGLSIAEVLSQHHNVVALAIVEEITKLINSGMCMLTGHPPTQGLFLQFKHLFASHIACSSL